jgi:heme/copper-type cytochrome/quinol oxidase subunit 3
MADDSPEYESDFPDQGSGRPYRAPHVVPPGTGTLGMWLFLIALFMLFAAVMVAYLVIRLAGNQSPPLHVIHFPKLLWISTVLVVGVSFTMSRSVKFVRMERQGEFRRWLMISLGLAIAFVVVQTPAMIELLKANRQFKQQGVFLYGLVFFLILVHALHVVGGIITLLRVGYVARKNIYDHEHYQSVRYTAMYWHFLDLVWLVMFFTFLVLG